jgi:glycerophosphoryl diester phosphodiesterase
MKGARWALVAIVMSMSCTDDSTSASITTTSNPLLPTSTATTIASTAPVSPAPDSTVPDSTVPDSTVPDSTVPDSTVPDSTVEVRDDVPDDTPATVDELLALKRPIVLAHTGGENSYPGGTMYAFAESVAAGVDVLDFNVLLSADGELVVQHDLTVDRTTDGTGAVAGMTYAQLFALDNAYWFNAVCGTCRDQPDEAYLFRGVRAGSIPPPAGYSPDDFAIPTLADVVARFPDALLGIEIKGEGQQALDVAVALAAELQRLGRLDATVVSSFDDAAIAEFHRLQPEVPLSPGVAATAGWVLNRTPLPEGISILQVPPTFNDVEVITPQLVADSVAAGYPVWIWPNDRDLENLASYRQFLEMGIVGLNINVPMEGVQAVREFVAGG